MFVKKITNFAVFAAVCLSLISCADKDADSAESVPDINCDTETVGHPFAEGYYESSKYTAKIVYLGNKSEISYGVSICENSSGSEAFFGTVYGVSEDVSVLEIPGYIKNDSTVISLTKDVSSDDGTVCGIDITCDLCSDGAEAINGSYSYKGIDWIPRAERDREVILDGKYKHDGFTLIIETSDNVMGFTVTDADGNVLFYGEKKTNGKLNSVMINDDKAVVQFAKCISADGSYIEVSASGYYSDVEFFGKYKQAD